MISASVVIRSYNEERHIETLCRALAGQQTGHPFEVILVDSGSEDRTRSIGAAYGARICRIDPAAFTFGRSLNLGIAAARGDVVAFISAHCYPEHSRWLAELVRPFSDPRVALVYGRQRGAATTKFSEHRLFERWFPEESNFEQRLPFCNNANAAVRRAVWRESPYDETLTGLEDLAWAQSAISRGHLLAYHAGAGVIHVHDETTRQVFRRYRREAMAFARIYPGERFSLAEFVKLLTLNVGADVAHGLRHGGLSGHVASILSFRACQFWGTYLGYRDPGGVTPSLRERFYYPPRPRARRTAAPPARPSLSTAGGRGSGTTGLPPGPVGSVLD